MKETPYLRLLLFILCATGAFATSFLLVPQGLLHYVVIYLSYPSLLVKFVLFGGGLYLLHRREQSLAAFLPRKPAAVAAIAAVTALLLAWEPFEFKIVYDEVILSTTAQMMHFDRLAGMPRAANDLEGAYQLLDAVLDKRPLVFPFLLSVVHDVLGFRYGNVFVLNGALTLVLVTLLYVLGKLFGGHRGGLLAVLLAGTLPLLSIFASSGHFEILNLVMICTVVLLSYLYLQNPSTTRLVPLVYALVILSQVRYENSLYVLPFGILILLGWKKAGRVLLPWQVIISPLFFMLFAMNYRLILNAANRAFQEGPNGREATFSLAYAAENLTSAANYLFAIGQNITDTHGQYGSNSYLLAVLGLCSVFTFCGYALRRSRRLSGADARATTALYLFFSIALFCLVITFFNFGIFDVYITSRLSLPLWLLFILLTPFVLRRYGRKYVGVCLAAGLVCGVLAYQVMAPAAIVRSGVKFGIALLSFVAILYWIRGHARRPRTAFLLLPAVYIVALATPMARSHRYSQDYKSNDVVMMELEFLEEQGRTERILWVSTAPYTPVLTRTNCLPVAYAMRDPKGLKEQLLDRNYNAVYTPSMHERKEDGEWHLMPEYDPLDPVVFRRETVFERSVAPAVVYRIERITDVVVPQEPAGAPMQQQGADTRTP